MMRPRMGLGGTDPGHAYGIPSCRDEGTALPRTDLREAVEDAA